MKSTTYELLVLLCEKEQIKMKSNEFLGSPKSEELNQNEYTYHSDVD